MQSHLPPKIFTQVVEQSHLATEILESLHNISNGRPAHNFKQLARMTGSLHCAMIRLDTALKYETRQMESAVCQDVNFKR